MLATLPDNRYQAFTSLRHRTANHNLCGWRAVPTCPIYAGRTTHGPINCSAADRDSAGPTCTRWLNQVAKDCAAISAYTSCLVDCCLGAPRRLLGEFEGLAAQPPSRRHQVPSPPAATLPSRFFSIICSHLFGWLGLERRTKLNVM